MATRDEQAIVIGIDGVPDGTCLSQSAIDRLYGVHRWGRGYWFYMYSTMNVPAFGFQIPIPFLTDYAFNFYFRRRPQWLRELGNSAYVIDWPWVRYTGALRWDEVQQKYMKVLS